MPLDSGFETVALCLNFHQLMGRDPGERVGHQTGDPG